MAVVGGELAEAGHPGLEARPGKRGQEFAVGGFKVGVRRQGRPVDLRFGGGQGGLVEGGEARRQGVDGVVQFGVGHRAGDPAVALGQIGAVVVAAEDGFQRTVPADQPGEAFCAATAGKQAATHLGMAEYRVLVRDTYTAGVEAFAAWLSTDTDDGLAAVATLVGAILLARATAGTDLSEKILESTHQALTTPDR